ncbi:hypothetical protein GH714_024256 [Hevea brasiliensis]|uniref:Formin-like protein n=1 Tax=Hevea brasiliensis TaxID=3981 RepID=A0A6A6KJA7_HEVBR|nr:hypothetical protein GH714_024256 [Hevea brasiliensis]
MPASSSSSFFFITFFVFSCASRQLSSTSSRRILHQPFFPQDAIPPSQPPSPSPPSPPTSPKIPFSTATPNQSPFFLPTLLLHLLLLRLHLPLSLPISPLILPQSPQPKPNSHKLLAVAISAVVSAIVVLGIFVFYYSRRWRHSGFSDDKTYRSDNSNRMHPAYADTTNSNHHKLRTTSTSSEFLYLGTLVNSHTTDEGSNAHDNVNVESDPRNWILRSYSRCHRLTGRVPCRISGMEKWGLLQMRRTSFTRQEAPSLSSVSTSPDRNLEKTPIASPRISNALDREVRSPFLSSTSTSPERILEKTPSSRISNYLDRNVHSPLLSSASTSPGRGLDKNPLAYPRISNVSDQSKRPSSVSSASSSPGNTDALGTELLESLLKMAPTKEEERKLKEYKDDLPTKLGHAEKFLKAVLDVPFAFKRVDAMLYITNFESEVEYLKRSLETLEAACEELRSSRMFLKLLEAVLKTGNRMNVGTNRELKVLDFRVRQPPNSTSIEDAKCRKLGLQVVSGLSSELTNVKKAAAMDSDVLSSDVSKLFKGIENINEVVRLNETMGVAETSQKFSDAMKRFMKLAEEEIIRIQAHESVALSLVKEITVLPWEAAKEEAHPFRIFMVVRDFLNVLDRVCKEVGMINERTIVSSAHKFPVPVNPTLPVPVNPTLPQELSGPNARKQYSFSDDDSASP